jgi:hypothetical protein
MNQAKQDTLRRLCARQGVPDQPELQKQITIKTGKNSP